MQSFLHSEAKKESPWKKALSEWFWRNIPAITVVLSAITSLSGAAWLILGRAHAPDLLRVISDYSIDLTDALVALYVFAFLFDFSRAAEFWMNREMGYYKVVAALFFAEGVHDLCLFAQNHRWDRDDTVEWIALGLLWTTQFWKIDAVKGLFSASLGFHGAQESEESKVTRLGLSPDSNSPSKPGRQE
jgi:hypothetical protein